LITLNNTADTVADPQWQINSGRSTVADKQQQIHSGGYTAADPQQRIPVSDKQQRIAASDKQQRIAVSDKQQRVHSGRYSSGYTTQQTQWQIHDGRYIYSDRYTARYTVPGQGTYSQRRIYTSSSSVPKRPGQAGFA
jgi:hypothetical protein